MTQIQSQEVYFKKLGQEKVYIVSEIVEDLAVDGTFNVQIENPVSSGKKCVVQDIRVGSDGSGIVRIHDAFSSLTSGTSSTIQNGFLDSGEEADEGPFNAFFDSTFTATSTHAIGIVGSGSGANSVGGSASYSTLMMDEGRDIVVEVTNTGSQVRNYAITVIMYELNR